MFTILWLIRSNQGVLDKDGETMWQFDWFIATLLTVLITSTDVALIIMVLI